MLYIHCKHQVHCKMRVKQQKEDDMASRKTFLGIELGSTRIKGVVIDAHHRVVSSGDHTWQSNLENGVWTYSLDDVWDGLKSTLQQIDGCGNVCAAGISAMMHGYLAFDKEWNLLVPFRTWQNTITGQAAEALTDRFHFNIPQRWSIAHLYQAILNGEPHVKNIAHITTLAGYVHYMLTGENVLGVGDASGMFPIDSEHVDYDADMLRSFDALSSEKGFHQKLCDLLPRVLSAGDSAGVLTEKGSALLDRALPTGLSFAPPEGDAGTGMVATNAVAPRTGNVSAGTSIFSMVVLENPLRRVYSEIDMVTTPTGVPVAMVHCNNCTGDMNAWMELFRETAELFGSEVPRHELFTRLYQKSLEGDTDCGGTVVCNYLAGEGVTHMDEGRPIVVRQPNSRFTLGNFLRAQLYSTMATMRIGMDLLSGEDVAIDRLTGHGGLFKTPVVGQRIMAAACNTPIICMETAGDGGPYGMALLTAYMCLKREGETLETYLDERVFADAAQTSVSPYVEDVAGFATYLERFKKVLAVEQVAVNSFVEG